MALKALRDNLFVLHAVDGRHYLGILDDGCYIDPMEIIPQRFVDEADGTEKIRFQLGMSYMVEPLCDLAKAQELKLPQTAMALRFEHVMGYAPANDAAADMYFQTKDRILQMRMDMAMAAAKQQQTEKTPDEALNDAEKDFLEKEGKAKIMSMSESDKPQ